MRIGENLDLAYCTNIHPANGWDEVRQSIARCSRILKQRLSPDKPFAVGLRLSNKESCELLDAGRLEAFSGFLKDHGLYVALLNGYVFGEFHRTPVKADVFAPDWQSEERVSYTLKLAGILEALLPENTSGGISTSPISYKPWIGPDSAGMVFQKAAANIFRVALELIRIERKTGKRIRLEIEPEPDGLLENSAETVDFFKKWLFHDPSGSFADELGVSREQARRLLAEHICVCFDACHSAIEYEEPGSALDRLAAAGIAASRIQLSSALEVALPAPNIAEQLYPFDDSVYLHQVIEQRSDGALRRFRDLRDALATANDPAPRTWRIHFHVPLFAQGYGNLGSTRKHIENIFRRMKHQKFTEHLEIETYTWDVLPESLKLDLTDSIEREYRWVLGQIAKPEDAQEVM
jgi:hypothetical protein